MSETSQSSDLRPNPAEVFDWRAPRTWAVFTGLALVFGFVSGALGVIAYLLAKPHFPATPGLDMIGVAFAFALHFPGLYLLDRLDKKSLPKDAEGHPIALWRLPYRAGPRPAGELPLMLAWMIVFTAALIAANEIGLYWWDTTAPMAVAISTIAAFACWEVMVPLLRPLVPATAA